MILRKGYWHNFLEGQIRDSATKASRIKAGISYFERNTQIPSRDQRVVVW